MKLKINEIKSLVYSDLFDYPLTLREMRLWRVTKDTLTTTALIGEKNNYLFLKGREKLVKLREQRNKISEQKLKKLLKVVRFVENIPTVQAIFVTGSIASKNAKVDADLDLMIVTSANLLWITRLLVVGLFRIMGVYRQNQDNGKIEDRICANIFLDTNNLEILRKNLYTAHEVLQTKCIFDRGQIYNRWLELNIWTEEYLPYMYKALKDSLPAKERVSASVSSGLVARIFEVMLLIFEPVSYFIQYEYMKGKITNEKIGWGFAFFHPKNLSPLILKKFEMRLKKLKLVI